MKLIFEEEGIVLTVGLSQFGGPEVLEIKDVEKPEPGRGQVRIAVEAAAINPVDALTRQGMLHAISFHAEPPVTLGWDVAGTIDAVGPDVRRLTVGDRVLGISTHLFGAPKAQSELTVLDETCVAAIPNGLKSDAASTLPLAGLTALQALDALALRRGQSVLVTGAAGSVGAIAVQVARARGLRVVAAGAPRHMTTLEDSGADWVVDTNELAADVRALVPGGVDASLDAASMGHASLDAVTDGGAHASLVVLDRPAPLRGIRSVSVAVRSDWEQLTLLGSLAASGVVRTGMLWEFSFEQMSEAHSELAKGGLNGTRLILRP